MNLFRVFSVFTTRVFLSAVFFLSGLEQLAFWHEAEGTLMSALCDWQEMMGFSQTMQEIFTFLISWAPLLLLLGVLFEILFAVMIFFGIKEKMASLILLSFFLPVTLLFHPFWVMEGSLRELHSSLFFRNLAIVGGLILVSLHGLQVKSVASKAEESYS